MASSSSSSSARPPPPPRVGADDSLPSRIATPSDASLERIASSSLVVSDAPNTDAPQAGAAASSSTATFQPRSSTPLGPHAMSPPKRPPPTSVPSHDSAAAASAEVADKGEGGPSVDAAPAANAAQAVGKNEETGKGGEERLQPGVGLGLGLPVTAVGKDRRIAEQEDKLDQSSEQRESKAEASASTSPARAEAEVAASSAPTPPAAAVAAGWRNMPGFEELSESWEPAAPAVPAVRSSEAATRVSSESGRTGRTESTVRPAAGGAPSTAVTSTGAQSDKEILRAGPTKASLRIPSHKALVAPAGGAPSAMARARSSSSMESQSFRDALGASAFGLGASPGSAARRDEAADVRGEAEMEREPLASPTSSSSSGAKAGSRARGSEIYSSVSSTAGAGAGADEPFSSSAALRQSHNTFGTARSPTSTLQAQADEAVGEATFVELSNAEDLPPILKPAWARPGAAAKVGKGEHMFTPLKLQSMWKTPSPPARVGGASGAASIVGAPTPTPAPASAPVQVVTTAANPAPNFATHRVPSTTFTFASPPQAPKALFPPLPTTTAPTTPRVHVQPSTPTRSLFPAGAGTPRNAGTPRAGIRTPRAPHLPLRLFRTAAQAQKPRLFPNAQAKPLSVALQVERRQSLLEDERRVERELVVELEERGGEEREAKRVRLMRLRRGAEESEEESTEEESPVLAPPAPPTSAPQSQQQQQPLQSASLLSGQRRDYVSEAPDFLARCRDVPFSSDGSLTAGEADEKEYFFSRQRSAFDQAMSEAKPEPLRLSQRRVPGETRARKSMLGSGEWEHRHHQAQQAQLRTPQPRAISAGPASVRSPVPLRLAPQHQHQTEEESPRRLLRRYNAVASAEAEVQAEEHELSPERRRRMNSEEVAEWRRAEEMRVVEERVRRRAMEEEQQSQQQRSQMRFLLHDDEGEAVDAHVEGIGSTTKIVRRKTSSMLHIGPDALPEDLPPNLDGRDKGLTFDYATSKWISRNRAAAHASEAAATTKADVVSAPADAAPRTLADAPIAEVSRETLTRARTSMQEGDSTDPFKDIESFGTTRDAPTPPTFAAPLPAAASSSTLAPRSTAGGEEPRNSAPPVLIPPAARMVAATAAIPRSGSTLRNEIDLFSDGGTTVQSSHAATTTGGATHSIHVSPISPRVAMRGSLDASQAAAAAPQMHAGAATPLRAATAPAGMTPLLQPPRSILQSKVSATPEERSFRAGLAGEVRSISFADGRMAGPFLKHGSTLEQEEEDVEASILAERDEKLQGLLEQVRELALNPSSSSPSSSAARAAAAVAREEMANQSGWSDVAPVG